MTDPIQDLQERVSKLEAEVARLAGRLEERAAPAPPAVAQPEVRPEPVRPPARPPRAAPRQAPPKPPRKPLNPILVVAGIGAGIFLIGMCYFLYWSIEQGWIGPELRFLLGLVAGLGISLGAARLALKGSPKFGACLLLAGLGTLMFTLRWGAFSENHFYAPGLGLAGSAVAVLLAGALAARARSGASLCVALAAGFATPLAFSEGGHHEIALSLYLAALLGAALAVPYLARTGSRWRVTRWLAFLGTWGLLAAACLNAQALDADPLLLLVLLHYALIGLWIWLPGQHEEPEVLPTTPTLLWFLATLATTSLGWALWKEAGRTPEWYAGPVLLVAFVNLVLVKPLRARLGSRKADLGLLVLAAGHLAVAVPVALEWKWVGPLWSLYALGLAWAVDYAEAHPDWEEDEAKALLWLAFGMACAATVRWMIHTTDWLDHEEITRPVLNRNFAEGLFAAAAWGLLARRGRQVGVVASIALELVVNLVLAVEVARVVRYAHGTDRAASIAMTLVWALSGALQWLRSLTEERKGLRLGLAIAGYAWLGLASVKLLAADLAWASTPQRALAALGVGAIFLVAALVANAARVRRKESE